jgi:hypothetical protein
LSWNRIRKSTTAASDSHSHPSPSPSPRNADGVYHSDHDADAVMSSWTRSGKCQTLSGSCGKGFMLHTRTCLREGRGDGKMCSDFETEKKEDCYINCSRPSGITDWGHPNDAPGIPIGSPLKGWYDVTGQGQPNDYCRWIGVDDGLTWACHSTKDPYVKANPGHIVFSGGPANKLVPFVPSLVERACGQGNIYLLATDPDLRKSIVNGFFSKCGSPCVFDHRNPKSGWVFEGGVWNRVNDMLRHPCGQGRDIVDAVHRYERLFNVRNAW